MCSAVLRRVGEVEVSQRQGENYCQLGFLTRGAFFGEAAVVRTAYPDPEDPKWAVVDIGFLEEWDERISLDLLKQYKETSLSGMVLFRQSRLSVQPVSEEQYKFIRSLRTE